MADEMTFGIGAGIEPGVYVGSLVDIKLKHDVESQYDDEPGDRHVWVFAIDLPSGAYMEVTKMTRPSTHPKSTEAAILRALLGVIETSGNVGRDDLVGRSCQLTIARTDDGFERIEAFTALPKGK